ncbi:MAG: UDP-glucose/GDP-mannose dehydrogenase family protein [Gracilibacteraceae bacterium]|jgi:UDPglucose 6-dehydrogenase|nr:UDP-glucose/GDP-mannose dehydrogenase family protein [Gracilibacteraceae bacterium]
MKIAIIGMGYVGLVTAACFAEMGNDVRCVDTDEKRMENLRRGVMPVFEPGLEALVSANRDRLTFAQNLPEALQSCEACFIAVGTPMNGAGGADVSHVLEAAREIGRHMTQPLCIVDKSTVPVGTAKRVRQAVQAELDARSSNLSFMVAANPEFLKEGSAVSDCLKPDRVIIGTGSPEAAALLKELYAPFVMNSEYFLLMDAESAEMTKYAANAMLAARISFMNEIANICERVGADVNKVRVGIGSDRRIGFQFIYPGCGYGGSCFPKDVRALVSFAQDAGYEARLLQAVDEVNARQKHVIAEKVTARFGPDLAGRKFAVWGLSFKPDTDDMREAASLTVIGDLTAAGAHVEAYDPKAMGAARESGLKGNDRVSYAGSKYEAVRGADALVLVTEWKEFRSPDFYEMKEHMKHPVIFDGRNQYDAAQMEKHGFEYYQIGAGRPA